MKTQFKQEDQLEPKLFRVAPINQDMVTLCRKHLTRVPCMPFASTVMHLHLAHNQISSLDGIQPFTRLVSLNLSHNQLNRLQQLDLIPGKQLLLRLNIRCNLFEQFGYQDTIVSAFPNLEHLDHTELADRRQIVLQSQYVRDNYVKSFYIIQRLEEFMKSLFNQIGINKSIGPERSSEGLLKLLYENISQKHMYELTALFVRQNQRLDKMKVKDTLSAVEAVIHLIIPSDVKCTCRPFNLRQALHKAYTSIFQSLVINLNSRHYKQLESYLAGKLGPITNNKKMLTMLQFMKLQPQQVSIINDPGDYLQKVNVITLKTALMESSKNKFSFGGNTSLTNKPLSYKREQLVMQVEQQNQQLQCSEYLAKFPVFPYSPGYILSLASILFSKVERLIKLHNEIHAYSKTPPSQRKPKTSRLQQSPQKQNIPTNTTVTRIPTHTKQASNLINEISFEGTQPESAEKTKTEATRTTRKDSLSVSVTRQKQSFSPQHLYKLSLKYKTLSALTANIQMNRHRVVSRTREFP